MKILFSNFLSYDWIIFVMAAVNAVVFFLAWKKARVLYESVAPRINISSGNAEAAIAQAQENSTYFSLYEKWQKAEFFYTLFCNLTGIFTLLGILGTVISLLHLVDSSADLTGEFMGALTSTLWGIIFTIVFKLVDSGISFHLDMGERITELIQMREYEGTQKKAESKTEMVQAVQRVKKHETPAPEKAVTDAENVPVAEQATEAAQEVTAAAEASMETAKGTAMETAVETVAETNIETTEAETEPDTEPDTDKTATETGEASEAQHGDEEA